MTETRLKQLFSEVKCDPTIYRAESFSAYKGIMHNDTTKLIDPEQMDENQFWEAYDNYCISLVEINGKLYFEVLLLCGDGIEKIEEDFTDYVLFNNNGARDE